MNAIKVLVADDHTIVRIGLKALLEYERDIQVVGEAGNGEEAVRKSAELRPDVVIMDLVMPKLDGVEATYRIRTLVPSAKILVLTTFGTSDGIAHALAAGAAGALMKTADDAKLVSTIRRIARGETYVSPDIKKQLSENPPAARLSSRQKEVLESITFGRTNKEIAYQLSIRIDSVEDIVASLCKKLGASNRAEAVAIALRKHLLKI